MDSFKNELEKAFLKIAIKKVTRTDINKGAYVIDKDQKQVLDAAGISPGHVPNQTFVPLYIIESNNVREASYYASERKGSRRSPEYRMGRFIDYLRVGDNLAMATDGKKIFVYKLKPNDKRVSLDHSAQKERIVKIYEKLDKGLLRQKAETAGLQPQQYEIKTKYYDRNPAVKAWVLTRSNYKCERPGCKYTGFRKDDNTIYIEVHHIIPLAEGGYDSINNTIALCPNCHRESHYSNKKNNLSKSLINIIGIKNQKQM